ncbi:unnamed protein product [Linum tenue]|uniref:Inositol polyphosphate-related phosphatase domain-containing protein n=1 Tax=Linum tenue TaxID=586396 RepID=A0AAV0LLP9_9ROSI|nr:unnamed protein product [Linum tenue]
MKLSWPKTLVKKWFNIKSKAEEFQADDDSCHYAAGGRERDTEVSNAVLFFPDATERLSKKGSDRRVRRSRSKIDIDAAQVTEVNNYRVFVATWNVAGKSPPSNLSLDDWLHTSPPADIYVLGFQEIVPLNAGNVLGTEDNGPARKWLALIRKTLNTLPGEDRERANYGQSSRYCLVASKQMVGIFLTVWVRSNLRDDVKNMKVSCVGRGLMGYLGNKKEGDELRRNSDVMEILRKTRFPRVQGMGDDNSPQTILDHDRIIWLGDLNYRIALSYRSVKALVEMRNWRLLLENDQACLRMEQRLGRVFEGWHEGRIYFPPTYKYSNNSDRYAGDDRHQKEKRRTPAWCDRILWNGRGLNQLSYVRGESKFSDHRPVYSIFLAEVESINHGRIKKSISCSSSRIEVEELLPHSHGYSYTQLNYF